jgi:hypothetical protein
MFTEGYDFNEAKQQAVVGKFGFEILKSRVGASPGATGSVKFWLKETPDHPVGDSDDLVTVMDYARRLGPGFILEGSGSQKLTLVTDYVGDGSIAFPRVGDCENYLRQNVTIYEELRRRVLDKLMEQDAELTLISSSRSDTPATSADAATDV